jgi:DNA-binding transcriptional LysR family regulator
MQLRHLRYFVAIAEERSITRAAERLWIAQPGLSTQVRRLEAELGIQLLNRHTREVELTAVGELFLERARAALAAAEEARATGANLEAGLVGTVRLGLAVEAPVNFAPSLLDDFVRFRPDIEVTVFESYAGTLMRDLRDGRLDAVIASSEFGSADLRSLRLASKAWVVLVGLAHRLAAPSPIGPDELHGGPIVMTGHRDGAGHDRAVAELLESFGVTAVERRGGPGPALYAAVVAGHAVALATAAAATGRELLARPLEPARQVRFALLWRAETPAPALSELIRAARQATEAAPAASRPALASAA